jgi:hypothetical protein
MEERVTYQEACELIAKMCNLERMKDRDNWTWEDIFNASPTGELFHVLEYYELAKRYFALKS